MCATKAGASNFISISMLADGKAPPAPPYYGIIEVQGWGARGMTTSEGDVGREKLGGKGKKKGFRNYRRPLWSPSTLAPSAPISTNCYRIRETPELSRLVSSMETIRDFEHLFELISMYRWRVKILNNFELLVEWIVKISFFF